MFSRTSLEMSLVSQFCLFRFRRRDPFVRYSYELIGSDGLERDNACCLE